MKYFKLRKVSASLLIATSVLGINPIGASAEWRQDSNGWWYTEGSSWAIGDRRIDNNYYYFDTNGYMATGWRKINGRWKYFDNDGRQITGLVQYGGKYYCMGPDGYMVTNTSFQDWYFNNDGVGTKSINIGEFAIDKATGTIGEYKGNETSLVIPSELEGIEIKSIGFMAFENCDKLTSVTIPRSVTYIGFLNCRNLTSIIVDDDNKNYTSIDGVVFNKLKTELTKYPQGKKNTSYIIPNSVKSIRYGAFIGCRSLTSVDIPDSVTNIEGWAFCDCSGLTSVKIPNSVISIKKGAFSGCNNAIFYVKSETIKQLLIDSGVSASKIIISA
ncbi:leucine-rich repeat protein [Clostridium beijerinckii]|uniref:leucine-rich repeat protein n=1 Tax=Clostridium beijerinckii TaxID=1520 RepID=UPI002227E553|nr:leucine-rich repeat protein [Clostridium beijerinckii]UYZ38055.1 leucine-rich repeat protein [Clostridium beijerinckii]